MAWAVDKTRTWFSHSEQSERHAVPVADGWTLEARRTFDAVGLAQQLANSDARFTRITLPLRDRVRHRIVQSKKPIMHRGQRSNSPKSFCSAEDRPSPVRRPAVCIVLENCPAVLHHQHRTAAPALGIFC